MEWHVTLLHNLNSSIGTDKITLLKSFSNHTDVQTDESVNCAVITGFAVLLVSVQSEIWIECWKPCNNSNQTLLEKFVWRVQLIKLTPLCFINITIIEDNKSLILFYIALEILCNFYAGHVIIESFYDWATWLFRSGTVNDFLIRTGSRKYTIPQIYNRSHTKGELFLIHFACIFRNSLILHFLEINFHSIEPVRRAIR